MQNNSNQDNNSDVFSLMKQMVAIPSVFPKEQDLTLFLENYLLDLDFEVKRVPSEPGRDNIVAQRGKSNSYICFYGHMDTVPPASNWQHNPYEVSVENDIARGLGVTDMKGGIAAILVAAHHATQHDIPLKIVFGVDEENISLGSYTLTRSESDFFTDVDLLISAESGQVFNENQDFAVNYGRKGRFAIEAQISGVAAHAARSDLAVNAIQETMRFLNLLSSLQLPTHPQLGEAEIIPFYLESKTDSFSIPDLSVLQINVLSVPGITSDSFLNQLNKVCKANKINVNCYLINRATPYMESYEVNSNSEIIKKLERDIFSKWNVKPGFSISVADENRFAHELNIPVISLGPVGGNDHTENEWVSTSSLEKVAQVYIEIIKSGIYRNN
jgi:acetylornithine deacetylase/succinyl-diaminopimelate desuccinylase-like protein